MFFKRTTAGVFAQFNKMIDQLDAIVIREDRKIDQKLIQIQELEGQIDSSLNERRAAKKGIRNISKFITGE